MRIAHELSRRLEQDANRYADATVFGSRTDRKLGELLHAYHTAKDAGWSDHHRRAQARFRRFWVERFGPDCPLYQLNDYAVEQAAAEIDAGAETKRKHLSYIVAAYHFARRKLKWIDEATDLTAVEMPRSKGRLPSYTLAEVRKILPKLEAVCDEAGWMGHAAFQSGRRSNALRHIEKADVRCFRDHSVVTFSDDHDKAGRTGQVVLVGRAHELTVRLMKRPGRYILGTTVPDETRCIRSWLRPAEAAAGVKHVKGRGWHAFKKRFATEARTVAGFEMQAGTRRDTLEAHYVQDDLDAKRAVAEKLNAALSVSAEE